MKKKSKIVKSLNKSKKTHCLMNQTHELMNQITWESRASITARRLESPIVARVRLLSSFRVIIDVSVIAIQIWCRLAIELIPPHANQRFLAENCTVWTQEIICSIQCAHMEHLTLCFNIRIIARE